MLLRTGNSDTTYEFDILLDGPFRFVNGPLSRTWTIGQVLDPSWIECKSIHHWADTCDREHGSDCRSLVGSLLPPPRPRWFVDTWRKCLVKAKISQPYVALSYVWGTKPFFRTTNRFLKLLQQQDALLNPELDIPRTIKDAVKVAEMIEQRYLWVDSICIVQDNDEEFNDQINNMASIYANAYVTIVAEQAEYAGFGLRGISEPRRLNQEWYKIGDLAIIERRWLRLENQLNQLASLWSHRAWTLQEQYLSSRKIVFENDTVHWECPVAICREEIREVMKWDGADERSSLQLQKQLAQPFPNLVGFFDVVSSYNNRQLSYQEDALAAFSGIMTALSKNFIGGFYCGIPVMFFDLALHWRPIHSLTRRLPSDSHSAYCLPSWSWVGWRGQVLLDKDAANWYNHDSFIRGKHENFMRPTKTTSLVQWYGVALATGAKWPIRSCWSIYQNLYMDMKTEPPPGWTRHYAPFSSINNLSDDSTNAQPSICFYRHQTDSNTDFWFPIPMGEQINDSAPVSPGSLLSCRTQKAWLHIGEKYQDRKNCRSVHTKDNEWAGILYLEEGQSLELVSEENRGVAGSLCEFALLSLTEKQSQKDGCDSVWNNSPQEWEYRARNKATGSHQFYNVLWIEWLHGIAYRRAYGQIKKALWDRQEIEYFDLILG